MTTEVVLPWPEHGPVLAWVTQGEPEGIEFTVERLAFYGLTVQARAEGWEDPAGNAVVCLVGTPVDWIVEQDPDRAHGWLRDHSGQRRGELFGANMVRHGVLWSLT